MTARFCIGVDLGTTNCAVSYVDLLETERGSQVLALGETSAVSRGTQTLPSLAALPPAEDADAQWRVGAPAAAMLASTPGRVIRSAKSWLCHDGVDRHGPLLPWGSDEVPEPLRLSPVQVSAMLLVAMRERWDAERAAHQEAYALKHQLVTITVPASFDEAAQRLTLEAAMEAGFPHEVRLLEEPQAAFYRWLERNDGASLFEHSASASRTVLVCDVGGGTTDLSLFRVSKPGGEGAPRIDRVAVSDHILLGGDNIDLAIAHLLEQRATEGESRLNAGQWAMLTEEARTLKERVLGGEEGTEERLHVAIAGLGAGLFRSSRTIEVSSSELRRLVLDGFFPLCDAGVELEQRRSGLLEWGLPYEPDSRVTAHVARFVAGHAIDAVLWNGGSLKPVLLRQRLLRTIAACQDHMPHELFTDDLDLSVARGAAFAGAARAANRSLIHAASARSFYVELHREQLDEPRRFLCVMQRGAEPGEPQRVPERRFAATVNKPVQFQLFASVGRPDDRLGDLIEDARQLHPLPPLRTELNLPGGAGKGQEQCEVELIVLLTELGLFEMSCRAVDEAHCGTEWKLGFDVRKISRDEAPLDDAGAGADRIRRAMEQIGRYFSKRKESTEKLQAKRLPAELEEALGQSREDWPLPTLRALWPALREGMTRRGRSIGHEVAWLSLAGYVLRPGYGADLDPFRIRELWRCFELGLAFPKESNCMVQWWILWRRVAGGLSREQQRAVARKALPLLKEKRADLPEIARLVASLERLPRSEKEAAAAVLLQRLGGRAVSGADHLLWSLARIGSRVPWSGGLDDVLPPATVEGWWSTMQRWNWKAPEFAGLPQHLVTMMRRTGDRTRDISEEVRREVLLALESAGGAPAIREPIRTCVPLERADQAALFGERLPSGLTVLSGGGKSATDNLN